jgi:hypothetical protein
MSRIENGMADYLSQFDRSPYHSPGREAPLPVLSPKVRSQLKGSFVPGYELVDIFPGSNPNVTAEQINAELNKVAAALEAGDYDIIEDFED